MRITVYGSGCKRCKALYESACEAVRGKDVEVEYVTNMAQVAAAGVMSTPALAVDGRVVSTGRVLKAAEVARLAGI